MLNKQQGLAMLNKLQGRGKNNWIEAENCQVLDLVGKLSRGIKAWPLIANIMENHKARQCLELFNSTFVEVKRKQITGHLLPRKILAS